MSTSFEDIGTAQAPQNSQTNTEIPNPPLAQGDFYSQQRILNEARQQQQNEQLQNPGYDQVAPSQGGGNGNIVDSLAAKAPEKAYRFSRKVGAILALAAVGAAGIGLRAGVIPNPFSHNALADPGNYDDTGNDNDITDKGTIPAEELQPKVEVTDEMGVKEFFALPDETRNSYNADKLADARAAANKQMNDVENLTSEESEILNQPRPKDKSKYTTSQVFAEISEGIYGAGMIADMDGFRVNEPPRVNEALKIHSSVVDPSSFNADDLIERYNKITIPKKNGGLGPGLYITRILKEYPTIHGGTFMGHDLGNNEARVAVIQDTRRDGGPVDDGRITTNLAVDIGAGTSKENWLNITLEEGVPSLALERALAEQGSGSN